MWILAFIFFQSILNGKLLFFFLNFYIYAYIFLNLNIKNLVKKISVMSKRGGCTSVDVEVTCDPDVFFWLVQNAGGGWWRLVEAGAHTAKQPLACCFTPRDGNKRQKINLVSLWGLVGWS